MSEQGKSAEELAMEARFPVTSFWSVSEAAQVLGDELAEVSRIRKQMDGYDYRYPEYLSDDLHRASLKVRDAVRYLMSDEADQ